MKSMSRTAGRFSRRAMARSAVLTVLSFALATIAGCFNTYQVAADEFRKLQTAEEVPRTIEAKSGEQVLVERDTAIYARSVGGRRYSITPFNFKMTGSQLVASDRDTLLALGEVKSYEVDHLNTPLTVTLISVGAAIAAGLIVLTVLTASKDQSGL